jgi:hypothetical protein
VPLRMATVSPTVLLLVIVLAISVTNCQTTCRPRGVSESGVCQNADTRSCTGGRYYRGACPGASNIQCCVKSSSSSSSSSSSDTPSDDASPPPSRSPVSRGPSSSGWGSYQPPSSATNVLGNLLSSVNPTRTSWGYSGAKATFLLPGGEIYIDSKMDTDCDGAPSCPSIDRSGQTKTSWTWKGSPIDALKTNYYVLPSNLRSRLRNSRLGLGDIAAVIYNGRLEFAVYADNGPNSKIGEGSVKLVQSLGFNPYRNGRICCGITSGVVVIVFPGSRGSYSSPYDRASVRSAGLSRFNALTSGGARAESSTDEQISNTEEQTAPLSPVIIGAVVAAGIAAAIAIVIAIVLVVKHKQVQQENEQRP